MKSITSLQITFRRGRRFAAYLHLCGRRKSVHATRKVAPSLVIDFDAQERPIGVEILAFDAKTIDRINPVLVALGHPPVPARELAPLRAA